MAEAPGPWTQYQQPAATPAPAQEGTASPWTQYGGVPAQAPAQSPASAPETQTWGRVAAEVPAKAFAGFADMFSNAPANLWNLAKIGYGTVTGREQEITPQPNFVQNAMARTGEWEGIAPGGPKLSDKPMTPAQEAASRYAQAGLMAAATGGASSVAGLTRAAGTGLATQGAVDIAGKAFPNSPAAQTVAQLLTPVLAARGGVTARAPKSIQQAAVATSKAAKAGMNPSEVRVLNESHQAGYVIPPSSVPGAKISTLLEGLGGKAKVDAAAKAHNQGVSDNLAAKSVGIDPAKGLTAATLEQARAPAYKAYQAVQDLPIRFKLTQGYKNRINQIGAELEATAQRYPKLINVDAIKTLRDQLTQGTTMAPKDAITLIRQLRADASATLQRAYGAEKPSAEQVALGKAQRDAAGVIEKLVEANLRATGSQVLYRDYVNARQQLAKTYDIETALNPATGHINPHVLAQLDTKGGGSRMTGDLRTVARFAQAFPKATPRGQMSGEPSPFSISDIAGGVGLGIATHDPLYTGAALARPALRATVLSKPVQRGIIPKP